MHVAELSLPTGIIIAATPLGNIGDASPRLVHALANATVVAAEDTRRTASLAAALGVEIKGQLVSNFDHNEQARVGKLIEAARTGTVLVVSDHGVTRMDGGICVNEWLWQNGWLAFKTPPPEGKLTKIEDADVDWSRTRAWSSGGYYGRVFLNVAGREPAGIVPADQYEQVRDELSAALAGIPGANGERLNTSVFKPEAIYREVCNVAPDLLVYFGNLHWRSVGTIGHGKHYTFENDTGPDDANHAVNGMFLLYEPGQKGAGCVSGHQLMDIAPTLLDRLGLNIPDDMQGRVTG